MSMTWVGPAPYKGGFFSEDSQLSNSPMSSYLLILSVVLYNYTLPICVRFCFAFFQNYVTVFWLKTSCGWVGFLSWDYFIVFVHCRYTCSSMFLHLPLIHFSLSSSQFFSDFLMECLAFFSIIFYLPPSFHKVQNILSHPSLFCFPFDSWYLFLCCFCDRSFETCPFLVHFLSFF